jgi:hypothetical protein
MDKKQSHINNIRKQAREAIKQILIKEAINQVSKPHLLPETRKVEIIDKVKNACPFPLDSYDNKRIWNAEINQILGGLGIKKIIKIRYSKPKTEFTQRLLIGSPKSIRF